MGFTGPHSFLPLAFLGAALLGAQLAGAQVDNLSKDIKAIVAPFGVDGQGAVAVVVGISDQGQTSTFGQGAWGKRRYDSTASVRVDDKFLIAGCGKSFTASVFGVLVTKGLVQWNDTVGGILTKHSVNIPDGLESLDPTYTDATITQLLQNRAGFAELTDFSTWPDDVVARLQQVAGSAAKRTAIRREYALYSLTEPPVGEAGEFVLSDIGYNVAAWLAEVVSGKDFEWMVLNYFARPLRMWLGFGLPYNQSKLASKNTGAIGQACTDGDLSFYDYDWEVYSPHSVGSGSFYMRIGDLANWAAWHVRGLKGLLPVRGYANVSQAAFIQLHQPFQEPGGADDGDYALGWYNETGPDRMVHEGSYAGMRTNMIGVTAEDGEGNSVVVAVGTNVDDSQDGVCTDAVDAVLNVLTDQLLQKYLPDVYPPDDTESRRRRLATTFTLGMGRPARRLRGGMRRHLV